MKYEVVVFGIPAPKGSVSAFPVKRKSGKIGTVVVHSSKSKQWESLVRDAIGTEYPVFNTAVAVRISFSLPRPLSVKREYPEVYPDLDKLARATLDALNKGVLSDDSKVVDLLCYKRYQERPGAFVGAHIWIDEELVQWGG